MVKKTTKKQVKKPVKHDTKTAPKKVVKKAEHKESKVIQKDNTTKFVGIGLGVIAVIAIVFAFVMNSPATSDSEVSMELHVMSMCPYGTQVEAVLLPVAKQFGDSLDLKIGFVGSVEGSELKSLHGQEEIDENIVHACALKYSPDEAYDFILCRNKDFASNWKTCAENLKLKVNAIETCVTGNEGFSLMKEEFEYSSSNGITGSPTIFLNGNPYAGQRTETGFIREICNEFTDKPELCNNIPEPQKVNMIVLNDKRCAECDTEGLVVQLKGIFPGLVTENVDYNTPEGAKLYGETGITMLPAVFFDDSVLLGEGYTQVQQFLRKRGQYSELQIGGAFDPTKEICDNSKDDTGNKLVDCEDPDCKSSMICREEIKGKLDVFIMSDCPYGKLAVISADKILDALGSQIDFNIHYIATENPDGTFRSLHGQYEVDENIRQLCVKHHYSDKFFDYTLCRSEGAIKDVDFTPCAEKFGINPDKITACLDGQQGKDLFSEDIKIGNALGISGSPSWFANNKEIFGGIDAEQVKNQFCLSNTELNGCDVTITSETPAPSGQC